MEGKYFKLELSLEHKRELSEDELDAFFEDVILVIEQHDFTCGGGIRPVDENGEDIASTPDNQ